MLSSPDVFRASRFAFVAALALLFLLPTAASAQYFGRNKVKYDSFDFRVLRTEHFDIYYYPEEREAAEDAARMAERWYVRLSDIFDHEFNERQPIVLYANDADFQQTNVIEGSIGQGTGGVTEGLQNRVVMPLTGNYADFDHVLGHELVHAFQYDIALKRGGGLSVMSQVPLWFIEGMAEYLSVGRYDPNTAMWLRDAVFNEDLPSLEDLSRNPRYFPYRYGQAFWAYVGGTYGDEAVTDLYISAVQARADSSDMLPEALQQISGDSLSNQWNDLIRATYQPLIDERTPPREVGRRVLAPDIDSGSLNISPSLSPDGKYVAFLSEQNLFSIDLFLADAQTGKVLSTLNSTSRDAHADALRFINSSGTWSPDGKQFAFVVFDKGDNEIIVIDVESRKQVQRFKPEGIGAISNPAWSPDSRYLAFSGIAGGISDLYLYDLETKETTQLTATKYSALHPAWSPDGRSIMYATDESEYTDFRDLRYADTQIALFNLDTRTSRVLNLFGPDVRHSNPQFAPDGRNVFFLADRGGFANIYRVNLATADVFQVTNTITGVSGITPLSPALTVSAETGRLMFSLFENADHVIHSLEPEDAQGVLVDMTAVVPRIGGLLPPVEVASGPVDTYLADNLSGLPPADSSFTAEDYNPKLRLTYVGAPTIGFAADQYGAYLGGSVSFLFSDVLGNQMLHVGVQAQGRVQDIGGQLYYLNRKRRLNWGGFVGRTPYMTGFTALGQDPDTGNPTFDQITYRIYYDQLSGLTSYPFSATRRVEAEVGYLHIGYDAEVDRFILDPSRQFVTDRKRLNAEQAGIPIPEGMHMGEASVALVGDNSFFGFTSPIQGWRYRLGVEGTVGSLNYGTLNADYRRYFFTKPVTFAVRGLHYGRYGTDSQGVDGNGNRRLQPLYLGYGTLVRGYEYSSFEAEEFFDQTGQQNDIAVRRLLGSRIGVINAEMRIPLFGSEELGLFDFPFLPTELTFFLDGGVAWYGPDVAGETAPVLEFQRRSADRVPVFSAGTSARVNLLGFAVVEFYYAYPFQRPDKGWHFGFVFSPGW